MYYKLTSSRLNLQAKSKLYSSASCVVARTAGPDGVQATVHIADALERQAINFAKHQYAMDIDAICSHCQDTAHFKVASPKSIFPILGYC